MNRVGRLFLMMAMLAAPLWAETYQIDPVHSGVTFRIRHLVSKVTGRFDKFQGTFEYVADKPTGLKAGADLEAASINTGVEKRDNHLRAPDFFDVAKCPQLTFKSTKATDAQGNTAKLHGELTMHCVTKPVVLNVEFGGVAKDPWGNQRAGVIATTRLNRKDFGIIWNQALDTGQLVLGDEVEVTLEIEGVAKKN